MAENQLNELYEKYRDPRITEKECLVDSAVATDFLKRLVEHTHSANFNGAEYAKLVQEICLTYHLSKGVSEFYQNVGLEKRGEGEIFCDFDDGKGTILLLKNRIIANSGAVLVASIYVSEEAEVLSMEDYHNLDLMLNVITSFISRRRLQRVVEQYIFFDENGYPNVRYYLRELIRLQESGRLGGMIAVNFDLHNFAVINMDIGRENGNAVIQNYFNMLEEVIDDAGCICRLGGDKFLCVFSPAVKDDVIRILSGVAVAYDENIDRKVKVSAAAGVYEIPENAGVTKDNVMERIMIATSVAKKQDEGAIVFYDDQMKETREHVKSIQQKFREGLAKREFVIYGQPKVDIDTLEIIGTEALCRWIYNGRVVPPNEFIPVLEQTTDICDLDFYMLDEACKSIRHYLDEGNSGVRCSVNFSRKHLTNPDLLENILKVVDDNNVPHELIEIELTETTTDAQFRDLKRIVNGLKAAGIRTAVDDFGIGYSSLNLIREIPWDVLKIDRCFVPKDEDDADSTTRKMFCHVVALAHDMGLECVVEGVETAKQIEILRENHCNIAQGFYFDKPLPKAEFEARLTKKNYKDRV